MQFVMCVCEQGGDVCVFPQTSLLDVLRWTWSFFFLITPGTLWMVSEFPFHKPYFPWQGQPVKSFGCFWDIFERGSREQSAATSLLIEAWTSLTPDEHNGIKPQFTHTTLWKMRQKVPFRVKNPLQMHSTDALYLKAPCPFPLGKNQFHRGKTLLASWTQLLLDRIHFSYDGCFHLWDIQKTTGSLSGPINLDWMSSSICLISVC